MSPPKEWTCEDCGYVNTCWCHICHGCQDVTSEYPGVFWLPDAEGIDDEG